MARPLISVVIPTYNRASLLQQTLESVLNQTLPPKEIIVVDDGSTDHTPTLMASSCRRDDRIRYLQQSGNRGADRARQAGFEHSRGRYVVFLDSDDLWHPAHLERCLARLDAQSGAAMLFTRYSVIETSGHLMIPEVREPCLSHPPLRALLFKQVIVQYSRTIYTRQAMLEVGGVPASVTADDWVLNILIAERFPSGIIQSPDCTVLSRFHPGKSASDPTKTRDSLLASTTQIFTALPAEWQPAKRAVTAINLLHCAVFFWHAGRHLEAWQCLWQGLRTDPSCLRRHACWSALMRLVVPASAGHRLRRMKHAMQRRRSATLNRTPAGLKTLYLCYFGLLEPLVQNQVLPYLRELRAGGVAVTLLTFEPHRRRRWSPEALAESRTRLQADGIQWRDLPYHARPSLLVTLYDIAVGAWVAGRSVRRDGIEVLHARSHVPMAMALLAQRFARCRVVFDFRGFLADEYAAAGTWTERSVAYRAVKWVERVGLSRADHIVVLTHRARQWLIEQRLAGADKIEVIPCCVDVSRFQDGRPLASASDVERFEVVYAGSVSGLYLLQEMGRFFVALRHRQPNALFRVLIPHGSVGEVSRILEGVGLGPRDCWIGTVDATDVPQALRRARLGLSFRRPTFAQLAACPTKIPEYLAMGIPVVCTAGVGDMDELLAREQVGVLVPRLDAEAYAQAASEALALTQDAAVSDRCRRVARERFDLQRIGGARYRAVYDRLRTRTSRPHTRVLFLVPYPEGCAPSQRLKFEQYYPSFEEQGIEVVVSPFMARALWRILYQRGRLIQKIFYTLLGYGRRVIDLCRAKRFDAVYIHLWALPLGPPWFEELLARRGVPILYDIDDLIYLPRASQANAFMRRFRKDDRIARIMQVARHVIVCTEYLRQVALRHNSAVTTIPSTINTTIYSPRRHSSATRAVTIGWSGSHSTAPYLRLIAPALTRLAQRFDIRLLVIGAPDFRLDGIRVETRPWRTERETADLAEMDIGVYPLPHEEWVLGKSGLKALQYMGMGIPVVASAIGAAMEFIVDGENGFLARDLDEWEARVAQLIQQPALRVRLGAAGRATVEQHFSVAGAAPVYLKVLASVLGVSFGAAAGGAGEQPALSLAEPVLERF